MKILITGAAGFIGSCFARLCVSKKHEVVALDALTYAGTTDNLASVMNKISFVHGNICDRQLIDKLLLEEKPDAVINFAAESHVDRSITDAHAFIQTNIVGTHILLEAIRDKKIRYVQISTDEVYGSVENGIPFSETHPLKPNSPYSASKCAADHLVLAYSHTHGYDALITRCSNNYGPHQYPEKLIPLSITNLFKGKKVPIYGDGLQMRDWIHVEDHCYGILAALERGRSGEVYNFGGDNCITNMEVIRKLLEYTGRDEKSIEYVKDRLGHDRIYAIDFSKARRELGWEPVISFGDGLKETVDWYAAKII
jgi:dTDP-glucose 4,6-dehydratase